MAIKNILIIGGGIAGLALAGLASKRGCAVTVWEAAKNFKDGGYVIGIWKNGGEALREMGLASQVATTGFKSAYQLLADEKGNTLKHTDLSGLSDLHGDALRFMLRGALHGILQGTLTDNVTVRFNCSLAELKESNGTVYARTTNGETGAFDLVIGADGIRSTTRGLLFKKDSVIRHNAFFYYGSVSYRDWKTTLPGDVEMLGRGAFLGIYPYTSDECGFYAALYPGKAAAESESSIELLRREFADFGWQVPALLRDLQPPIFGDWIQETAPPKWSCGRCILIGDAAHALLPTSGQGISMALEDALLLDKVLAKTENEDRALDAALTAFEQKRRARIAPVRRRSRRINLINRLATRSNPLFHHLRKVLARTGSGAGKARRLNKLFRREL